MSTKEKQLKNSLFLTLFAFDHTEPQHYKATDKTILIFPQISDR